MKILFLLFFTSLAFPADEKITVTTEIVSAIHLYKQKDLDFGEGLQGDMQKIVSPKEGAEFTVIGEGCRAYFILFPESLTMKTGAGAMADEQIQVTHLQSHPDKSGMLDCSGKQTLYIGATRAALQPTQKSGNYLAPFTVTVLY